MITQTKVYFVHIKLRKRELDQIFVAVFTNA